MITRRTAKNMALIFAITILFIQPIFSLNKKDSIADEYRRSSLHIILLESDAFLNKDLVMAAYDSAPFPDKYNDHRLAESIINLKDYGISKVDDNENTDEKKGKLAERKILDALKKYMADEKIANKLVAKWFNRQDNGAFDMSLIHERGSYDATALEAEIAKGSIRGVAALKDAGEELIKNTFVVVNRMFFIKNEMAALAVREAAYLAAEKLPSTLAQEAARIAADKVYEATKDGYSVWTTSYLFQLDWNEDIANTFYMEMWMDKNTANDATKEKFDTTSIFKMKYIGFEKAKSLVLIGEGKDLAKIIQLATVRNIDKVYTKLQKAYDVFKTKTPIYGVDPIWAKIGLKEGVEPNDKFEVLEQVYDKKTGTTKYKQIAIVKVDKKNIWDNRYNMADVYIEDEDVKTKGNPELQGTYFKGGNNKIEPGMLLRQVK